MGSGKTTLGARIAAQTGVPFVDLDAVLESEHGATITELFAHEGEAGFRQAELACLERFARAAPTACIVATGGGIVETRAAHALLRALGTIVWLRADPEAAVARLEAARARRPLLAPGADWRARWDVRAPLYRDLAAHVVDTHPQDVDTSLRALAAACGVRLADAP